MWIETAGGYLLNLAQCLSIHVIMGKHPDEPVWEVVAYDGHSAVDNQFLEQVGGYHVLKRCDSQEAADKYRSCIKMTFVAKMALITV